MTSKFKPFLSKEQTLFFKGLAIVFILLHNFFHLVTPVTFQNELEFDKSYILKAYQEFSLEEAFNIFFSFFGHYGTFVFIFLSGYGLCKSFQKDLTNPIKFILRHIGKVYFLLFISALIYLLYCQAGAVPIHYKELFCSFLLINNFSMRTIGSIAGPWWFFSLIIQLYLFFVPLFYLLKKDKFYLFLIIYVYAIFALYLIYFYDIQLFASNSLAHIPEFSLGIFIALYEKDLGFLYKRTANLLLALFSLVALVGAQYFEFLFVFGYLLSVIFTFSFCNFLNWKSSRFFEFSGKISPYLFGINGFFFRINFVDEANLATSSLTKIFYGFEWLVVLYITAFVIYLYVKAAREFIFLHKPL